MKVHRHSPYFTAVANKITQFKSSLAAVSACLFFTQATKYRLQREYRHALHDPLTGATARKDRDWTLTLEFEAHAIGTHLQGAREPCLGNNLQPISTSRARIHHHLTRRT